MMMEDEHTEFKEEYTPKMIKSVVAFLNTDGGSIYLGVDDDGRAVGLDDVDVQANAAVSGISDNVRPDPMMFVSVDNEELDGHQIVRINVAEGIEKPYYWKEKGLREGGVFIRRGPTSMPASEPLIRRMMRDSRPIPYESLPSLNQNLTFDVASAVFSQAGLEFGEPQMRSMGLMDGDMYTNLALLISDQCPQGIKMAVYDNEYKNSFLDRAEASGSIFAQYEAAFDFVDRHNNHRSVIGKMRRDIRDYPDPAVREVIVNALVHRDYSIPGSILLSMYDRSMSVSSIGGLSKCLGIDDLVLGVSSRRNEKLAAIMYRLGYVESYGTGIPRIMGLYSENPDKPVIEVSTNVFKITLPKMSFAELSPMALRIVSKYVSGDIFSRSDLERDFGITRNQAYSLIKELVSDNYIEIIGSGRSSVYRKI